MMTETREAAGPEPLAAMRFEAWRTYNSFIEDINPSGKKGFLTLEDEFLAYGKFIKAFRGYVQTVRSSPLSPQDRDFIKALILQNEDQDVSLEFLSSAKENLLNEAFYGHPYYMQDSENWPRALEILSGLTDKEYAQSVANLGWEREAREALNAMSGGQESPPEAISLLEDTEQRGKLIQKEAVRLMTQERGVFPRPVQEDLNSDVLELNKLVNILISLSEKTSYDAEDLTSTLKPFEDFLGIDEKDSWVRQLAVRAGLGQHNEARQIIQSLLEERSEINKEESEEAGIEIRDAKPEFMWHYWGQKGILPEKFVQSFDDLIVLTQLADAARYTAGAPLPERAAFLAPFLKKGVSSVVIKEIVEDRLSFDETYFSRQIEALLPHIENDGSQKGTGKLAKKLIMAVMLATVLSLAKPMIESQSNLPDEVTELLLNIPSDQLADLEGADEAPAGNEEGAAEVEEDSTQGEAGNQNGQGLKGKIRPNGRSGEGGAGEDNTQDGQDGQKEAPPEQGGEDLIQPKNTPVEKLGEALNKPDWNIQGDQLKGFYVSSRASYWNAQKRGWVVNSETEPYVPTSASYSNQTLSKTAVLNSLTMELPAKIDHKPNTNHSLTFIVDKKTGEELQIGRDFNINQRTDGSSYLTFVPRWQGKEIKINFSLIRGNQLPKPTSGELNNMRTKITNIRDLPKYVQDFAAQLTGHELSLGEEAKLWEQFIKTKFFYSLSQEANKYYFSAKTNKDFFNRIFELKKTDCDVANTALAAVLRAQGIASRLVYGYANTEGALNTDDKVLSASERHGWVEAYIGGKLITLDATPTKLDDETKKELMSILSKTDYQRFENQEKTGKGDDPGKNKRPELPPSNEGSNENSGDNPLLIIPPLLLLNYGLYRMANLIRKRNRKRVGELKGLLEKKAGEYTRDPATAKALAQSGLDRFGKFEKSNANRAVLLLPPSAVFPLGSAISELLSIRDHPLNRRINDPVEPSSSPSALEFYTKVVGGLEAEVLSRLYLEGYREAKSHLNRTWNNFSASFQNEHAWHGDMIWKWFHRGLEKSLDRFHFAPESGEAYFQRREALKEQIYTNYSLELEKALSKTQREFKKKKKTFTRPDPIPRADFDHFVDSMLNIKLARWQLREAYLQAQKSIPYPLPGFLERMKKGDRRVL